MPVKIFSTPGDHRDDFTKLEQQINDWMGTAGPEIVDMKMSVNHIGTRDTGQFMMTVLVHYEEA